VAKLVSQVVNAFQFLLEEFELKVDITPIDPRLRTKAMRDAEFSSIVINLVSNAIKASIAGNGREIMISATREHGLIFRVLDRGIGLQRKRWEEVFEPVVSDPDQLLYKRLAKKVGDQQLASLGLGTGLGLSIVRGIAEANGGSVSFVDPPKDWATCIEVLLR
jgi:signal transduction histidine kinase